MDLPRSALPYPNGNLNFDTALRDEVRNDAFDRFRGSWASRNSHLVRQLQYLLGRRRMISDMSSGWASIMALNPPPTSWLADGIEEVCHRSHSSSRQI